MTAEGLTEAERTMLSDGTEHTTEAQCWTSSCSGSLPWVVERILADRLAAARTERDALRERVEALAAEVRQVADSHEAVMDSILPMPNRDERESGRKSVRRLRAALDAGRSTDRSTDPSGGSERA